MKELHEKRAEEANMAGDRVVCVTWHDAVIFIKNAPTIDAIEVVRCKDCKYYVEDINRYVCVNGNIDATPTDYCSWGEKDEID